MRSLFHLLVSSKKTPLDIKSASCFYWFDCVTINIQLLFLPRRLHYSLWNSTYCGNLLSRPCILLALCQQKQKSQSMACEEAFCLTKTFRSFIRHTASDIATQWYYAVHSVICFASFLANKISLKLKASISLLPKAIISLLPKAIISLCQRQNITKKLSLPWIHESDFL